MCPLAPGRHSFVQQLSPVVFINVVGLTWTHYHHPHAQLMFVFTP